MGNITPESSKESLVDFLLNNEIIVDEFSLENSVARVPNYRESYHEHLPTGEVKIIIKCHNQRIAEEYEKRMQSLMTPGFGN